MTNNRKTKYIDDFGQVYDIHYEYENFLGEKSLIGWYAIDEQTGAEVDTFDLGIYDAIQYKLEKKLDIIA